VEKRLGSQNLGEVLEKIQQRRTSANGVFGIKIHYSHIAQFGSFSKLTEYFPDAYYIVLTRKDVLSQAVSLSIAKQTGVWISGQEPISNNPTYSYQAIDRYLRQTLRDNASWRYLLSANGCNFIEMDFDSVREDLPGAVSRIARFTGIDVGTLKIPDQQATRKQSNNLNLEWKNRFIAEFSGAELFSDRTGELYKTGRKIKRKLGRLVGR